MKHVTSRFALDLYAANLVDQAMEFERLEKEVELLKQKLSEKDPICPICLTKLKPFNYRGYYDSFSGWECECNHFEGVGESAGAYA